MAHTLHRSEKLQMIQKMQISRDDSTEPYVLRRFYSVLIQDIKNWLHFSPNIQSNVPRATGTSGLFTSITNINIEAIRLSIRSQYGAKFRSTSKKLKLPS